MEHKITPPAPPKGKGGTMLLSKPAGECTTVGELLSALSKLTEDKPMVITTENNQEMMTVAYKCSDPKCGCLHLGGGRDVDFVLSAAEEIFFNRSKTADVSTIKKSELIPVLQKLDPKMDVLVATIYDEGFSGLASVYVCPHCDSTHLTSLYYVKKEKEKAN